MKRILEQPKIIVYENVEKIVDVLEKLYDEDHDNFEFIAEEILKVLGIDKGKKTEISMFENNVQATLVTNKKGIAKVVIGLAK
jgi:hypothetical protein